MFRIICLIIGYFCGLIQTGYYYGQSQGVDIRTKGSGNSGATNSLRVFGLKAGAIVFFGDALKTLIPCVIVRLVIARMIPGMEVLYMTWLGAGVILGHNYPFYLQFKGGKGIASTAGFLAALDWRIMLVALVTFVLIVLITEYVSLGSILVVTELAVMGIIFQMMGQYGIPQKYTLEFAALMIFWAGLAIWRHRSNVKRLLAGCENKTSFRKKG